MKLHIPDTAQGTRSPIRHTKKTSGSKVWILILILNFFFFKWVCIDEYVCEVFTILQSECAAPPTSVSDELNRQSLSSAAAPEISNCASGNLENWMVLSIAGEEPTPRFNV